MEILNILKETEAFMEGHFLLSSGKHSDQYVQCAKVLRFPQEAARVLKPVVEQLQELSIDKVIGPAMGGIIVSYEIGRQLGKEAIFTERVDGVMELRRGFEINPGDQVIITEDVVTTGKSAIETKKALETRGAKVLGLACIADRRPDGVDLDMPIYSAIKLQIKAWDPKDCPICKENKIKLIKPGSRKEI